ncbi:hypothetical protein [Paenibacillus xylanivorans]|uniref:hypothetical protein n=1 Tax=Paenibacillus xylanivorans TaxID=1705561 RepID=UPI000A586F2C|nr:hypothetical protein [Paenibacillus xylanivorans]
MTFVIFPPKQRVLCVGLLVEKQEHDPIAEMDKGMERSQNKLGDLSPVEIREKVAA